MPFGTVKNPKNSRLYVRFRLEEKRKLSGEAKKAGLTMSEYVRRRALGLAVKSRVSEQAINELRRLGGLQKYLALKDPENEQRYQEVLAALLTSIKELDKESKLRCLRPSQAHGRMAEAVFVPSRTIWRRKSIPRPEKSDHGARWCCLPTCFRRRQPQRRCGAWRMKTLA